MTQPDDNSNVRATQGNFDHLQSVIEALVNGHNDMVAGLNDVTDAVTGTYEGGGVVATAAATNTAAIDSAITALRNPAYLVTVDSGTLANDVPVGTTPGGELGGTWAAPTVDATHSGSAHHAAVTIGVDGEHSVAGQVLSGTDATSGQKGHVSIGATAPPAIGTAAAGAATTEAASKNHVHATGAGTPSTQAFGDAAATGTGPAAAMTDHKHAMPADPVPAHAALAPAIAVHGLPVISVVAGEDETTTHQITVTGMATGDVVTAVLVQDGTTKLISAHAGTLTAATDEITPGTEVNNTGNTYIVHWIDRT